MSLLYAFKPQKDRALHAVARALHAAGATPDAVTAAGLIVSALAGITASFGHAGAGVIVFLFGACFDMLDGSLARSFDACTEFGRYFDSVCDRLSESVFMAGAVVGGCTPAAFMAAGGSWIQLAARAYNHHKGLDSDSAPFGRPERLALLVGGLLAPSRYRPLIFTAAGLLCLISSAVIVIAGQKKRAINQVTMTSD